MPHGKNILGPELSALGRNTFRAWNPSAGAPLDPPFHSATPEEIDRAMRLAEKAFHAYRKRPAEEIAAFLDRIGAEIEALGTSLLERTAAETGLGLDRLASERTRTVNQLRMFAHLVREGSWVDARIDRAIPDRKPIPKPDLRRMLVPIGPVIVFGASNFPLAFSVAGGDTASALAAGNPVVVKANRAHPGASELVAEAIRKAAEATGIPPGVFSLVHGVGSDVGMALVKHPLARAAAFTGSPQGGRALFDAAAQRPDPIPVFAEMGSANPVFLLPGALRERGDALAEGLQNSMTLGVGQFCTKPGVVAALDDPSLGRFVETLGGLVRRTAPGTMLHPGILTGYEEGLKAFSEIPKVRLVARAEAPADPGKTHAKAAVFLTDGATFLKERRLREEIFGPSTLVVACASWNELEEAARALEGHLTATLHGTEADLGEYASLVSILETKVGRLVFNGFPTGVEVCPSMHHGGPWPATTDARFTSVGTAAIQRFARPVCYQNFPDGALPPELQRKNARNLWRLVDGQSSKLEA